MATVYCNSCKPQIWQGTGSMCLVDLEGCVQMSWNYACQQFDFVLTMQGP